MSGSPLVPKLAEDDTAFCVNCCRDFPPSCNLRIRPDARRIMATGATSGDDRSLANDERAGDTCSLFIVL